MPSLLTPNTTHKLIRSQTTHTNTHTHTLHTTPRLDDGTILPDDFTIAGSDDGDTVGGWDLWGESGNTNTTIEEEDDEEELTRMERNVERLGECLAGVEDGIGGEKAGRKR